MTVLDFLAHVSGLSSNNQLTFQGEREFRMPVGQFMALLNDLVPEATSRTRWKYKNWDYNATGPIVARLSG